MYLALCTIISFILAHIYSSPFFEKLLRFLGIRRTVHQYIWKDIEDYDKPLWVRVTIKSLDRIYYGMLVLAEVFERKPQIVLSQFQEKTLDGEVINDYLEKDYHRILIDTDKCDKIEFVYFDDSEYLKVSEISLIEITKNVITKHTTRHS